MAFVIVNLSELPCAHYVLFLVMLQTGSRVMNAVVNLDFIVWMGVSRPVLSPVIWSCLCHEILSQSTLVCISC